jgi:hypothetical protein
MTWTVTKVNERPSQDELLYEEHDWKVVRPEISPAEGGVWLHHRCSGRYAAMIWETFWVPNFNSCTRCGAVIPENILAILHLVTL